jgi:glycine/D-amino acid oxidase-like deaminating enzyme/nitrite reductase/ring-hydroxylating ferredoxin subunit
MFLKIYYVINFITGCNLFLFRPCPGNFKKVCWQKNCFCENMIKRDGTCTSLWQENAAYLSRNSSSAKHFDVAIVGGGITGITTGLLLQQAGKSCVIFEAQNLGFGTTGGTTAHLNTLLDTPYTTISKNFGKDNATLVAQAATDALNLIEKHVKEYEIFCDYEKTAAYLFSQDAKETKELKEIHDACLEVGLQAQFVDNLPISLAYEKVMHIGEQAKFHPIAYLHALAAEFEHAGGIIKQQCQVHNVSDDNHVKIETSHGSFTSNSLIYATHIPLGVNILHTKCLPYRSYAMAVKLASDNYPAGLCYDMKDPYHYYRTQIINGSEYFIAGGFDHKTGHEPNTELCFRDLENHIRKHFNVAKITHRWSSQYFESVDGLPFIGRLPGHTDNVFVATGYGGNGMTYSHVAAVVLSDLIVKGESRYEHLFSPTRIKPLASFTNFVTHNADVIKEFVGKWFSADDLNQLADLAPDEGKVVRYEGSTIALYKDLQGTLHAVSPTCKHMGCGVNWNRAERSWDCPCHGARYSFDGQVLTGPAETDLNKIEVRQLEHQ